MPSLPLFDVTARLVLSPALIVQALRVRRHAQLLPEAAGSRTGRLRNAKAPPLALRIIGDSSAAGVGVAHQSRALAGQLCAALHPNFDLNWHLDAASGATTRSTLAGLQNAVPSKTDIIVVALGVNDVTRLIPVRLWRAQHQSLLDTLRQLYQPRQIYLSGIPPLGLFPLLPQPLRWTLGRHAAALDRAQSSDAHPLSDVTHLPFDMPFDPNLMAVDGFHPNAELYEIWAKKLASRIISDWP